MAVKALYFVVDVVSGILQMQSGPLQGLMNDDRLRWDFFCESCWVSRPNGVQRKPAEMARLKENSPRYN